MATSIQRISRNAGCLFSASIINLFLGAGFAIIVARWLGPELYGKYTLATSFALMFSGIADMGVFVIATREISRHLDEAGIYVGTIASMRLATGVAMCLAVWGATFTTNLEPAVFAGVLLVTLTSFVGGFASVTDATLRGLEIMHYEAGLSVLRNLGLLGGAVVLLKAGKGFLALIWLSLGLAIGILAIKLLIVRWMIKKVGFRWSLFRYLWGQAAPLGGARVTGAVTAKIDSTLLGTIVTPTALGWFKAAQNFVVPLWLIPQSVSSALLPVLSRFAEQDPERHQHAYIKFSKIMHLISFPLATALWVFAHPLINLVFGSDYLPAVPALQIMAWSIPIVFWDAPLNYSVVSTNRQILTLWTAIAGLIAKTGVTLLLLGTLSHLAPAVASLATPMVGSGLAAIFVYKYVGYAPIPEKQTLAKIMASSALAGVSAWLLLPHSLTLAVIAGAGLYLAGIWFLEAVDAEDITLAKAALSSSPTESAGKA